MTEIQRIILLSVDTLGALNQAQMKRFLFETGIQKSQDIAWPVAQLREEGILGQIANDMGIQYVVTEKGRSALKNEPLSPGITENVLREAESYRKIFATEQDFLATYSESASKAVPVFLSIRQREKILFKIQVIVHDVETAKLLQKNWREHANEIFRGTWELMAPGVDQPKFE